MDKEQMKELLMLINNAYPRFLPDDKEQAQAKVELWKSYMKDWEYERTKWNIRKHIETSVFEPKIAEVKAPIRRKMDINQQLREGGVNI